jgi:hypothetical protein
METRRYTNTEIIVTLERGQGVRKRGRTLAELCSQLQYYRKRRGGPGPRSRAQWQLQTV